jgi:hypothetical protein
VETKDYIPIIIGLITFGIPGLIAFIKIIQSERTQKSQEGLDAAQASEYLNKTSQTLMKELEKRYDEVSVELDEVKEKFERKIEELTFALYVRDEYIDHLVQIIHLLSQQIVDMEGCPHYEPKPREDIEQEIRERGNHGSSNPEAP